MERITTKQLKPDKNPEPQNTTLTPDQEKVALDLIEEALPSTGDEVQAFLDGNRTEAQGE